jgi:AraC-like DNA-binding protein
MNLGQAIAAATLVAVVLIVVAMLWVQRRTRSQMRALMNRLDELERLAAAEGGDTPWAGDEAVGPGHPPAEAGDRPENHSRDVLAGRTSFVRRAVEGELSRPASLAGQVIALVHARIGDSLTPAELAAELAVSLRTLERGLSGELSCTPRQLITAMKMREARRLLATGRYRVNEVATRLGYATPSHFSRSFRGFYRQPPSHVMRRPRS